MYQKINQEPHQGYWTLINERRNVLQSSESANGFTTKYLFLKRSDDSRTRNHKRSAIKKSRELAL
jgi:hypothetical protein